MIKNENVKVEGQEAAEAVTNAEQVLELAFTAQVVEKTFKNTAGDDVPYLAIEMLDPFGEDIDPVSLSFERAKGNDNFGNKIQDSSGKRTKGVYMHYVKKALKETEDITLQGRITRKTFKDNKKKVIDYICLELKNLNDDQWSRVYINSIEGKALFENFAKERIIFPDTKLA